jgi:glycerol-3-phosphate dehydrogenase (NAD(P)+)
VRLWGHDPAYVEHLARTRRNPKFLPGIRLPEGLQISSDFAALAEGAEFIFSVIPTQYLRGVVSSLGPRFPPGATVISCSKGIERGTLHLPSRILAEALGARPIVVLSGPSHAEEVARGLPATVVAASRDQESACEVSRLLSGPTFRVYTNPDPLGVEIGGAVKNVIALAAGIADGIGLGDNARAALITRGAMEIARLGLALGARRETFMGLSGIGDLIVTCTSDHSRNRGVGVRIGKGETLELILRSSEKVPEGVETTRSLLELARHAGVDLPITREVHAVLFEEKPPSLAVESLMARSTKDELEDLF